MDRFFGGHPAIRKRFLTASSIRKMSATERSDWTTERTVTPLARKIYEMGFDAVEWALQYFLLGAVIVFPIWFVARLFKSGKSKSDKA